MVTASGRWMAAGCVVLALVTIAGCSSRGAGAARQAERRAPAAIPPATGQSTAKHPNPAEARLQPVDAALLQRLLERQARKIHGDVAIAVRVAGSNGREAAYTAVNADVEKPAASLIKLPLMAVLEEEWQTGTLGRDPADRERVRKAITVSDNAAADGLIARLGMARVNEWLEKYRFTHTRLLHKMLGPRPNGPNVTTAADVSRMLLEIELGNLVSGEGSVDMRKLLLAQERRSRIPAGLPPEAVCGNKTGTLRGIVHDAAFVECPNGRRYSIAVLVTHAPSDSVTSAAIARLSRSIYSLLSN